VTRALVLSAIVAVVAAVAVGRGAAAWSLVAFAGVAFAEWRGGPLARGALRGFGGGLVALVLPASILRPCCDAAMMAAPAACCTMPSMCGAAGATLGLAMALVWPRERSLRDHAFAGAGVALGALAVAAPRCSGLLLGESLGLALGLVAGVAASMVGRGMLARRCT
jgi:hypothetical protein